MEKPGNQRSDSLESPSLYRVGRMSIIFGEKKR
jgi:hypothetical protein